MREEKQYHAEKKNRTKILLAVLAGLAIILIAAAAFIFVSGKMKEKNYSEAVLSAEKYLAANNYEDAVIQYKKAISVNPKEEDAYLALADVYVEQEEISKAKAILRKGQRETSSFKIKRKLEDLNGQSLVAVMNGDQEKEELTVDLKTASQNIAWNTSFLQKIIDYRFEDYKDQFGFVKSTKMDEDGYLEIEHNGLGAVCFYRNTETNKEIVDVSRKTPTEKGMPEKISLHSLGTLFRNFEGGASLQRLQMLFGEKVTPKAEDGRYFVETKTSDCIFRFETDANGNIVSADGWNEIILLNANAQRDTTGHISGVVIDAVSGDGVPQAVLTFQPTKKENKEKAVKTDAQGVFSADLEPDIYTILITADNYIEEEYIFEIEEGRNYSGEQFSISPKLKKGTARIVLEWNAEPQDLDSYLMGSTDDGKEVSVNFRQKEAKSGGDVIAALDLDDIDGYGPETTTIYNLNGVYQFQVADFRRTGTMKENGATVKVYLPGKAPVTITIDPGADVKDIWIVCEIDHGELNVINKAPQSDEFTNSNK